MNKKLALGIAFVTMLFFSTLASAAEMVNINKANAAAIQQNLVGIGPIKAESIISYRKKNGKFKSLDDLQNVKGLGPALIKKNKRYMSLSKGVVAGDDKAYAASKKQAGKAKSTGTKKKSKTAAKKATAKKTSKATAKTDKSKKAKTTKDKASKKKTAKQKTTSKKPAKKSTTKKKTTKKKKKKKKTSKSTT